MFLDNVFINDTSKTLNWRNRNYCFVITIFIVLLNIGLYATHESFLGDFSKIPNWGAFSIANLFQALVNTFTHANWQHVLLNMLCFFFAGLYLERKQGSIKFLSFMFILSLFTAFASSTNDISLYWYGFSGANYGLYGYILLDILFTFCKKKSRSLFNIFSALIILALIYLAMCFNGGTAGVGFAWYPYDLLNNLGHASGFSVGLVFGFYEKICELIHVNRTD